LSWQIVPSIMPKLMSGGPDKAARVMNAFMKMKKLDIATIQRAYDGN
jgi:predicted 3-demethylubiquinone-9 3-methyltransferase (glyoxalase superfamily)